MEKLLSFFLFISLAGAAWAESIAGSVLDISDHSSLGNVFIENIYTRETTITDDSGRFSMQVQRGELLEFKKLGYKTVRLRMPQGQLPQYFKIIMEKAAIELPQYDLKDNLTSFQKDSIQYYSLYKNFLEFPKLTGLQTIQHPFTALSKRNRQIWAFQDEFQWWQHEKYVDYTFNEATVKNLTGLQGDSLKVYMKRHRPSYEQLRSLNEYTFYQYIMETVEQYRTGIRRYRRSPVRTND